MKRFITLFYVVSAVLALFVLAGCGPFAIVTTTPRPTGVMPTAIIGESTPPATPTGLPSETPAASPTATSTSTAPEPTATATSVPTIAAPTATSVPPTATNVPPTATGTRVPPTATRTPVPATATPVTITDWKGEYYNNVSLQGSPKVVRNDLVVDFTLPKGTAPATNMPSENWSARWSRTWNFDEGNYRFHLIVDDGARLWVNNRLLIDAWTDGGSREYTADLYLKGNVPIVLEYYNHLGDARVRLNWEKVTQYSGWMGSYYPVRDLTGLPMFQRDDANIDFNWGTGSPRSDIPVDNFSVRWARRLSFQAGLYRFQAHSDDGVRVYVDGKLVIDAWRDGQDTYQGDVQLTTGQHDVRVDYYEHTGQALIQVSWKQISGPTATPSPTWTVAPATATPTRTPVPPTATATQPAVPTATPTQPVVPTATPTTAPTAVPPAKPSIVLQPAAGPIGKAFTVTGHGFPANATVQLSLSHIEIRSSQPFPVGEVVADGSGSFTAQIAVPGGQGWEGAVSARVTASAQQNGAIVSAVETYRIQPALLKVSFTPIVLQGAVLSLPEPTYLALDSAEAWAQAFGPGAAQPQPAIDWQREIVLAAFPGQQYVAGQLAVKSVVQREGTVTALLNVPIGASQSGPVVQPFGTPQSGAQVRAVPYVLVRIERRALQTNVQAPLTFVFLDAEWTVLAQGPAGAAPLLIAGAAPKVQAPGLGAAAAAPAGSVTGTQGVTESAQAPEAPALLAAQPDQATADAAVAVAEATQAAGQGENEVAPQAATVAPAGAQPAPARSLAVWIVIGLVVIALAILAVYLVRRRV